MANSVFETATNTYKSLGCVGDGGCGTVYRVADVDREEFALKLLRDANTKRRKRFKNELAFCRRNQHERIIRVLDEGVYADGTKRLPFYVMPLFVSTLRKSMHAGIPHDQVLRFYNDILDGAEAAHLLGVIHRDLKPENLLIDAQNRVVVADFGIAHFREEDLLTAVETRATDKLANYRYSAPEQRTPGAAVDQRADIFALGYILNEMFTGDVPHGAGYKTIAEIAPNYAYLDPLVDAMIQQSPANRPGSIGKIKAELIGRGHEFVIKQRLDAARRAVVPDTVPNDPLAGQDVRILASEGYAGGLLTLRLSAAPPPDWIRCMQNPRFQYSSILGDSDPRTVQFRGDLALLMVKPRTAETTARHFADWVERTNLSYRERVKQNAVEQRREETERLRREVQQAEDEARVAEALRRITF